jgi:hypothetical protein
MRSSPFNFATDPWFQFFAGVITTVGTVIGVYALGKVRRTDKLNQHVYQLAARDLEKNRTDDDIRVKKDEATRISSQIQALRNRIETEIPLEARRTVLRDRLDGNIKDLQQNLSLTLDLKRQLAELGSVKDIPSELLEAVKAEILPEYIQNAHHELLKTYLIIILVLSSLTSAFVPHVIRFIIQVPLAAMGGFSLYELIRDYVSGAIHSSDRSSLKIIIAGLIAASLTTMTSDVVLFLEEFGGEKEPRDYIMVFSAPATLLLGIGAVAGSVWLIKTRSTILARIAASLLAVPGLLLCLLGVALAQNIGSGLGLAEDAGFVILLGVATIVFGAGATRFINKLNGL